MKKIILSLLIIMLAIVANAQTTLETVSVKISDDWQPSQDHTSTAAHIYKFGR